MSSRTTRPGALDWLADRDPGRWRFPGGEIRMGRLAQDIGVNRTTLWRQMTACHTPSQNFVDWTLDVAESTGISRERAEKMMFSRTAKAQVKELA